MSKYPHLSSPYTLGDTALKNRAVMAPMTRSRAIDNIPNDLMAEYYAQRAGAGLIITEGTSPSPNGLGYPRIPGIYSAAQTEGWRKVTKAVHDAGSRIFIQLMHVGRIGHPLNLPAGAELVAPSAIVAAGEMYTDAEGPKPHPVPRAMTADDVEAALGEYVAASKNAIEAGFDGVELHGANGYLIDQFLNPKTNQRDDAWGGSPEARNRFAIEAAKRTVEAIGRGRVGIRISPYGVFNDLGPFDGIDAQYEALAAALGEVGIAYVHLVDHSAMGAPPVSDAIKQAIRKAFGGTIILSGGYDAERAEADLAAGKGELVAFGRPFLANPDLLARFEQGAELNAPKMDLFYTPGPEGYTDYPTL
ncbi:MAG: alkene reductase [Myxococcales bacterium]|nr:alkene reductase [Myxococcales bacterium]